MIRALILSDIHGEGTNLRWMLEEVWKQVGPIDAYICLGDGVRDFQNAESFIRRRDEHATMYAVRGNNDWGSYEEGEIVFQVGGVRFYACHGHQRYVKYNLDRLWYAAREREAQVVLYGHTHSAKVDLEYGVTFVNPGSVGERYKNSCAYAEILIEDNGFVIPSLCKWD